VTAPALPQILIDAGVQKLDPALLKLALTHASKNRDVNNERLEFLGDRVLSLAIAHEIYTRYPGESEGDLALRHAALARADVLAGIARAHELSADILVAHGEQGATARLDNVMADCLEALIGAVYLDQGYDVCARAVGVLWAGVLGDMTAPPRDPKTILQEWVQGRGLPLPVYAEIARSGPDHAPEFTIEVRVKGAAPVSATGLSRRLAEKAAAMKMMEKIITT
jgi:ribonuclease-3